MKLLGIVLLAVFLAGCALVPAPYPVYGPSVSVGVGVPVYPYPYSYPYYGRYYAYPYPYYARPYPHRHWN